MKLLVLAALCCVFWQQTHHVTAQAYLGGYKNPVPTFNTIGVNPNSRYSSDYPNFNPSENSRPVIHTRLDNAFLFDARISDVQRLKKALDAAEPDTPAIINVLAYRTNLERRDIAAIYENLYRQPLIKAIKEKYSGWFKRLAVALIMAPTEFYVKQLHDAMDGLSTDKTALIEIFCTFNNNEIRKLRSAYEQTYRRAFNSDIHDATSGDFKKLMIALASGVRDESYFVDLGRAKADARRLLDAGKGMVGTNETVFISIMSQNNPNQLLAVANEYQNIAHHSLESAIDDEFSGSIKKALLSILLVTRRSRSEFFAERLYESMEGLGTDNKQLVRIIAARSEIDLPAIKSHYRNKYHTSLEEAIADDTSGDYKHLLLAIVKKAM